MTIKSIALVVAGVGRQTPTSGSSAGIAWCWGPSSLDGTVVDSYEWIGGHNTQRGLVEAPETIGSMVNPFTAQFQGSAFSFRVHKDALAGALWLPRPSSQYGFLGQALTDSATTIKISSRKNTVDATLDGTVIWVGDEAILLGDYDAPSGNFQACTRAYYSTIAQTLPKGMSVYRRNPRREDRRALLIEHNHDTSTTTTRWQGFVSDFDADSPIVNVETVELLSVLRTGVINRGDTNSLRRSLNPTIISRGRAGDFVIMRNDEESKRRVNKASINSSHWVAIQNEGGLFFAEWESADGFADFIDNGDGTSSLALGSKLDDDGPNRYEVFAVDRAKDEAYTGAANLRSSTHDLSFPFHPIEIAMAFLTSGYDDGVGASNGLYDVLGFQWGLGIPSDWFGVGAISTVISDTEATKVDQMVLGWDGEPVKVWEVVENLMRMGGFFPGNDEQGRIIFARLRMATVADKCDDSSVTPIPFDLHWTPSEGEGVDQVRGLIGKLPWNDGQPYQVNVQGDTELLNPPNSLRAGVFGERRSTEFNLPYRYPIEDETEVGGLIALTAFRAQGSPRLTIRANSGDYAIGDIVEVGDPNLRTAWFYDIDGQSVSPDGSARWFGLIIGRQQNLGNSTDTLTLLMVNYHVNAFARYRAPSGEVKQSVSGTTYTFSTNKFTGTKPGQSFNVGDVVELWTPDGTRRSTDTAEITSVTATTITLDADFATTGQVNDIIRLAHLSDSNGYPTEGHSGVTVDGVNIDCALAYVYLADANETLGPSDVAAHVYGGRA